MNLKELRLNHFRNYASLQIHFSEGITIFFGENAQGKTNILEAIYVAATSKSHRTNFYREMIKKGEESSHITVITEKEGITGKVDLHLCEKKRNIFFDGIPIFKLEELLGKIQIIMFSPQDLDIVKGGPSLRRRFLDMEISQIHPFYYYHLRKYHRLLKQRNTLLKNSKPIDYEELSIWDEELAKSGRELIQYREKFISDLSEIYQKKHYELSGKTEWMKLCYEKNMEADLLLEKLKQRREKDRQIGSTYYGPHKDDILFTSGEMDLRIYGSQGQCRTAALALKLSELELMKAQKNTAPILLLDDVLSELDQIRQQKLVEELEGIQTLITCTGVEDFLRKNGRADACYHVKNGAISREKNLIF